MGYKVNYIWPKKIRVFGLKKCKEKVYNFVLSINYIYLNKTKSNFRVEMASYSKSN